MILFTLLAVSIIIIARFLNGKNKSYTNAVNPNMQKMYYIKLVIIYSTMLIRKIQNNLQFMKKKSQNSGYGVKSKFSPEDMDTKQPLSEHPKAIDAVYFNLAGPNGWHLIVGSAHRPHGVVNGFLCLKVPNVGLLVTAKMPDTMLFRSTDDRPELYGAEGIVIYPFQPMKVWKIQFNGTMHFHDDPQKKVDVQLNAVWNSALPYFDFDTDMNLYSVAQSIAEEPWSREYFNNLKEFHQTHYEQHGDAHLNVAIDEQNFTVKLNGVRDHSYAYKREWKLFHRYILHFITLENDMRMSVGIVCTPIIFSRLVIGYVYLPDGTMTSVKSCTLQLSQHGQNGTPPSDYGFCFEAGNATYEVQVRSSENTDFFIGWEWESRIVEQFATFRVNGVKGWGAVEWQYRNVKGRPLAISDNDPSWTKEIKNDSLF